MRTPLLITSLLCVALSSLGQDATVNAPVSDPVTSVRVIEVRLTSGSAASAQITVGWFRQSGVLDRIDSVGVTDGDPSVPGDDYLTGNGITPKPTGLLLAIIQPLGGEAGSPAVRYGRRVMTWLKTNRVDLLSGVTVQ